MAKDARGHGSEKRTLYHVTSKDRVASIMRKGLKPGQKQSMKGAPASTGKVYLTNKQGVAFYKNLHGGDAAVLAVRVPKADAKLVKGGDLGKGFDEPAEYHVGRTINPGDIKQVASGKSGGADWQLKSFIKGGPSTISGSPTGYDPKEMAKALKQQQDPNFWKLGEAKDARGHGSEKHGVHEVPTKDEVVKKFGAALDKLGAKVDGVQDLTPIGREPMLAYTDHVTGSSLLTPLSQATLDHIAQRLKDKRASFAQNREAVASNLLITARVIDRFSEGGKGSGITGHINPALTAEARAAYEGGRGSNQFRSKPGGRAKFAPEDHEPEQGVRVEPKAVRAERIRQMKVDPVRAEIIRKAIGMRASLA